MNFHELDNFNLSDTVKYHNRLNPRLWGRDEHLLPDVREKLLAIAEDFREFLGVDDLRVQDITLSGSNAAYNYTDRSDIDLHLVVDMPDDAVYQELFNAKKYQYNNEHNLTIGGADVELYVQPSDQPHVSQGIYSVKDGKWLQVPRRKRTHIDDSCVRDKAADLDARIHAAVESNDAAAIDALWNKIKTMRETGLEQHGEFGCENIVFKVLRDQGCIKLLKDAKLAARDRELSLAEQRRVKPRVTYGFKDPVTEDVTITPDGVSASTRMFLSEKGDQDDIIVHDFIQHVVKELGIDPAPEIKLHNDPEWSESNHSFGRYDPDSRTLNVSLPNRHILDVLRTVAHELVHCDQHQTHGELPASAGETGSAYENDANARAGIIMRDFAAAHPEYFGQEPLGEGASGYIPKNRREAAMPQYAMALSVDVKPGQTGREANKMGLQTGPNGEPTLLMKNLRNALKEFKETGRLTEQQDLFEIRMSPTSLRKEAAKTGALAGMEFEMIVPNTQSEDDYDQEPDYDADERASSPQDIRDFFYDGDFNSRRSVEGLIDSMMSDYSEWQSETFDARWESDSEQFIYDYIKDNMDDDDVRAMLDLESEDPVGRQEYLLASDMINTDRLEPWYEDAQENAREEFFDDDLFEEWLEDSGLTHMSDIESRYSGDITWPHYRSASSGEGASVQETAESFSQAVGRPARASESYHAYGQERPAPGKNFYVVEPDASLEPDDPDDAGLEFVSPPLPIDEIMSDLNKVKRWADLNGCYTNSSTGLHINISVPNYSQDKLDFVKLALLMGDEYVLEQFGRASNTYAKSAMGKIRSEVGKGMNGARAKAVLEKMTSGMEELASKAIHSGITEKYTSINTKDGHVEFRSPGGDWLGDNFDLIENTLLRFTVALSAAMDPKAYREEYLKKLYKVLNVSNEGDPLAIFARYAAGQGLPAQALKSFVRQAQAERKAKKSGEEIVGTPAAGMSTTQQHPWGRGRPNDPNGLLAIVRRDDQRNYGNHVGSEAPDYLFRFTLQPGYSQAQLRAVMQAWAARNAVNADDYMIVDTTQFAEPSAAPESGSVQWNIIDRNNNLVHTFWNRNVQADANAAAQQWLMANDSLPSVDMQGPFDVVPAAGSQVAFIPGSTLDLQHQRQTSNVTNYTSQAPTPIPGVQDIEIEIPPAQTQWEVYDRNTDQPVFRMYATTQAEAWRKGQEWVANYSRMTPDQEIDASNYSVRQSTAPVTEGLQDVVESVNDYLWHGSRNKHDVLYPQQANDTGGKEESNKNAIYATPSAKVAIAMGLTTPGSDTGMFPNDPQMILFKGGIRKGEMVYLHKVAKDLFIKHNGREWYSKPEVEKVKPIEVIAVPVDKWLHLIRQATPKDLELQKKYTQKQDVTESISVLEQRLRQELREMDRFGNQPPTGPETPPEMPDGTIKVDVSDMYDWYKLGQHISDLSSIDKSTLGSGPPSTVFAFGSEDLENKYSHELTNLGLKTHDLDEPGEEDVDEGQETYLSPNMIAVPNQDPNSPEDWDYHYKGQQIKPGDPFHSQIKDLHLRQLDPTYDAFRNAFDNPIKPGPALPQTAPQGDTIIPSRPVPPAKIKGPDGKPLKLKDIMQQDTPLGENFADGRHPEDKGDSKRHHVPTKSSVSNLRRFAKSHSGRAAQLAHWMANMKAGRAKAKKKTNETVIGNLHFPQLNIAVDDHAIDRTRTRGINPHTIDLSLRKLNAVADQLSQIEPNAQVWAYDAENNLGLGMRRISSRDMLFKLKTVVAARPFDGAIPIIELS